jgi:hypothetical protein
MGEGGILMRGKGVERGEGMDVICFVPDENKA